MFQNREIVSAFFDFEQEEADAISSFRFHGFLVWPIVKSALCYRHLKKFSDNNPAQSVSKTKRLKIIRHFTWGIIKVFFKRLLKAPSVLFLTKSVDKLARINGRYFNFLVDSLITRGIVSSFLYVEEGENGDYRQPSTVKTDIKMDGLTPLVYFFRKGLNKFEVEIIAQGLAKRLNDFLIRNNWAFLIDENDINELLLNFHAEYKASKFLLRIIHPKLIISSERIGTGFLAAAKSESIRIIDLQHGLIDSFEPMYQYAGTLSGYKDQMFLPDLIAVWGSHHQRILLQHNFWDKNEVYILGNQRMELNRGKLSNVTRKNQVLFATQWTAFKETCQLLELLDLIPQKSFQLVMKMHPMEPEEYKTYFKSFAHNHDWVQIEGSNADIYRLFGESKVLLGFNSASLIEAAALQTPCVSLTTDSMPEGIYSLIGNETKAKGIRTIPLTNTGELVSLLNRAMADDEFYKAWQMQAEEMGNELFARNVFVKAKEMVNVLLSPGNFRDKKKELNTCAA